MATEDKAKKLKAFMRDLRKVTESTSFENSKYGEVTEWIDTGDYGLNRLISGDIHKGMPAGRVALLGGASQCTPKSEKVTILRKLF